MLKNGTEKLAVTRDFRGAGLLESQAGRQMSHSRETARPRGATFTHTLPYIVWMCEFCQMTTKEDGVQSCYCERDGRGKEQKVEAKERELQS